MEIVWVHNFSYPKYVGGAELTDFYWIKKGIELRLKISEIRCGSPFKAGDVYMFGNFGKFNLQDLERKINGKPYICIVHGGLITKEVVDIYDKARALVCMSPNQQKRLLNMTKNKRIIVTPPYIDTRLFYNFKKPRVSKSYLYVGAIREHKGIRIILEHAKKHLESNYHFYGPTKKKEIYLLEMIKSQPNCSYHGLVLNDHIPDIMNKYKTFIWYLDPNYNDFESFGRTVIEALLCGMRLEINRKNFGAFSWNWDFNHPREIAKKLEYFYSKFWDNALKVFEN